jgi:hypothetical protein
MQRLRDIDDPVVGCPVHGRTHSEFLAEGARRTPSRRTA